MKRWLTALFVIILSVSFAGVTNSKISRIGVLQVDFSAQAEDAPKVQYFYQNICESCTPEEDFLEEYERLTGKKLSTSQLEGYNVFHSAGWQALEHTARSLELSMDEIKLPMVVVDGTVYMGASALQDELPRDALEQSGTGMDTVVLYLYLPACESCAAAETVLNTLPAKVSVKRGSFAFTSDVVVRKIDLSSEPQTAYDLFEHYQVLDTERVAPIVFIGSQYLSGADAIGRSLESMVKTGRGLGTYTAIDKTKEQPLSAWSMGGTLAAGVIAGLNPCALSMLLLFLSVLMQGKRHAGRYVTAFLLSKYICYLLIGTALLGLLQRLNPTWLLPVTRWTLTLVGGGLVTLNLWDAWQVRKGALGRMRNQLPKEMRKKLHRAIGALQETSTRRLLPFVSLLGFIVAAGEFLCAGQVYLAGLLSALQSGAGFIWLFILLTLYCMAFLLPSAVLCLVVVRSKKWMAASGFLADHMGTVKLVTALAMVALIVLAWLV